MVDYSGKSLEGDSKKMSSFDELRESLKKISERQKFLINRVYSSSVKLNGNYMLENAVKAEKESAQNSSVINDLREIVKNMNEELSILDFAVNEFEKTI